MKLIIVEDEAKNREMLRKMVELYCPEVAMSGTAASVPEAVTLIKAVQPDIILMDIELHPHTCFDIFPQLDNLDFEVIFTTAYKDYAIEAIRVGALDYLLKPVNRKELQPAIRKAVQKRSGKSGNDALASLLKSLKTPAVALSPKISLYTTEGIVYAEVAQIIRCEARGSYTNIYFKDKTVHITSKMLKEYEFALREHHFFRVHNSHLVSLAEVAKYVKADGGFIQMKDGSEVPVSASHKEAFLEQMKALL